MTVELGRLLLTPSHKQIRAELHNLVLRDLLGPAGGEEEIIDGKYVRDRYILGRLAPKGKAGCPMTMKTWHL